MRRFARPGLIGYVFAILAVAVTAHAQDDNPSGLARAILALDNAPPGTFRDVDGRLFRGLVDARIIDQNRNLADFASDDLIDFTITGGGRSLTFDRGIRTREEFEDWARDNAQELLAIIFPSSLSSATLGRDAAQMYAQQLLLSTVLGVDAVREPGAPRRYLAGGLVELEWFERDDSQPDDSGWAWQWLYGFGRFASVQGRYARMQESLSTNAWAVTFDYHPYLEIERNVIVRFGASARTGFLYSHSEMSGASQAIDLGTVDFGGGGWASVRKNFRRVRVGGGMLFQGTKSFVPVIDDDEVDFLAGIINGRGISWDVAYGGTIAVDTSTWTAVIAKYLESRSVKAEFDRPALHLVLIGYSFTLGPGAALDAGYKFTSTADVRAQSVFVQGNFGW